MRADDDLPDVEIRDSDCARAGTATITTIVNIAISGIGFFVVPYLSIQTDGVRRTVPPRPGYTKDPANQKAHAAHADGLPPGVQVQPVVVAIMS